MIVLGNRLADCCQALANLLQEAARRLRRCEECGRNQFYGEACKG